uniref:Ionotropic glutamate receptor L-glutamate and glycine-binding domain-containing protein n=1 Tax=Trichuris muris TaxID=70415 RepID=A0A5S6QSS0_TRIMR
MIRVGISLWDQMHPECTGLPKREMRCRPGPELDILQLAAAMSNLTITFVHSVEKGCGLSSDNGTSWTSLMGMLSRNEIDVTGNICYLMKERLDSFAASRPIWYSYQAFLIKKLEPPSVRFKAQAPFSLKAWTVIIVCIMACAVLDTARGFPDKGALLSLRNGFSITWQTFMLFAKPPKEFPWTCTALFFTLLKIYYTTYVLASLLYPAGVHRPFNNIVELANLLESGEYTLLHYHPAKLLRFEFCPPKTCAQLTRTVRKRGIHYVNDSSPHRLLQTLIDNNRLVLISTEITLEFYLSKFPQRDKLWLITDNIFTQMNSYFWRADFRLRKTLDHALTTIGSYKMNVLRRYVDSEVTKSNKYPKVKARVSPYTPLRVDHGKNLFVQYSSAVAISLATFATEFVVASLQRWIKGWTQKLRA